MKVIVLGARIVGTASVRFLRKAGYEVTGLERQLGVALETSFANGCQISVPHEEQWENPCTLLKVLNWLGFEDAPLLPRRRLEPPHINGACNFCASARRATWPTTSARSSRLRNAAVIL